MNVFGKYFKNHIIFPGFSNICEVLGSGANIPNIHLNLLNTENLEENYELRETKFEKTEAYLVPNGTTWLTDKSS